MEKRQRVLTLSCSNRTGPSLSTEVPLRYALYFSPPEDHPLSLTARAWLGRDAFSGENLAPPVLDTLTPVEWRSFTTDPRRYGFHATIKAPFRLKDDCDRETLLSAFDAFCRMREPFPVRLTLATVGPFFALVEDEPSTKLAEFAASVVTDFEKFRAPLSGADYARRKPERLSERERALLDQWGYPYVFDQFQFHMSLTGPVPVDRQEETHAALKRHFKAFIGANIAISHLALFEEPEAGADFRVLAIRPLGL